MITYLEKGELPEDPKAARELALTKSRYLVDNGVVYWVKADKTLRVIPPTAHREQLVREADEGKFGAHLRDTKIHGELNHHYWWPGM